MLDLINGIASVSPLSLAIVGITVIAVIYGLPKLIRQTGIKKLGPIELEHRNQTTMYNVNKQIDTIDLEARETLWDLTEELFDEIAYNSALKCSSAVYAIVATIASPVRTMVLLNHIAPKLSRNNEQELIERLLRGVHKALRHAKAQLRPDCCPVDEAIKQLDVDKYRTVISDWITVARKVSKAACTRKIAVYEEALHDINDKHWTRLYKGLIDKNAQYIKDMGD